MPAIALDTRQFEIWVGARQRELGEALVTADIVAEGEAAKYALVWDVGAKGKQPGKRTIRGKSGRLFSKQAPTGYVVRHVARIIGFMAESIIKVIGQKRTVPNRRDLQGAVNQAAERGATLIGASAPQDTGKLKGSIRVKPGKG